MYSRNKLSYISSVIPRVQALQDVRSSANKLAADLLDESQSQATKRLLEPKQAKGLIDRARNFLKKDDFIKYAKKNIQEFPDSGFTSGTRREIQATQKTANQYITSREQDLGELWDIAHTNYSPTAGKTFTEMLRREHNLLNASENLASKMKGTTLTGKLKGLAKKHPYITGVIGAATYEGAKKLGVPLP